MAREAYRPFMTTRFPEKKMVVLTCMDTRLTELLPQAMNFRNGDIKLVKNAGAVLSHPFGSVMRSIMVAIYELKAREVCVVGHHGCGMTGLRADAVLARAQELGVSAERIETVRDCGVDLEQWLTGFEDVAESVINSVNVIKRHPLLPPGIPVHGLIIHPETGALDLVVDGYAAANSGPVSSAR
ncbi:MAG TPA: carbonic anhydrase [Limnochordia bacterium]|nr:carbonic anhydrase [Limnochordia bacterium]